MGDLTTLCMNSSKDEEKVVSDWTRNRVNSMYTTPADAHDAALEKAVMIVALHAVAEGPEGCIKMIKKLRTDTPDVVG